MMKKLIFMLVGVFALFASSCTNEASLQGDEPQAPEKSAIRTEEEAIQIAQNLATARHGSRAATTVSNIEIIGSKSRSSNTDTLIYAVNYADHQGFALISAAKCGESLLGYTDYGSFEHEKVVKNENFCNYIETAKQYVLQELDTLVLGGGGVPAIRPITTTKKIAPRISVQWGQRDPEGIYCPNGVSGCVQTALAQILTYIGRPSSITLTYPERDQDVQLLDWIDINKHEQNIFGHDVKCKASQEAHNAIGRLCRELGYRNNAIYSENETDGQSTGATIKSAHLTISKLLGNEYIGPLSNITYDEILWDKLSEKDCVIFISGFLKENLLKGHAWVCDGGEEVTKTSIFQKIDGTSETITERTCYNHFNWGSDGGFNGYFYAGVYDTVKVISRDNFCSRMQFFCVYK